MKISQLLQNNNSEKKNIFYSENYKDISVMALLTKINEELHLVFQKRTKNIAQGGEVSFAGGHFEKDKDKDLRDTAIRETCEEMGIDPDNILDLHEIGTFFFPIKSPINVYLGFLDNIKNCKPSKDEVEYIFTVPLVYFKKNKPQEFSYLLKAHPHYYDYKNQELIELLPAKKLKLPKRYHQSWRGSEFKIFLYEYNEEIIWGITAEIVRKLTKLLKL